MLTLKQILVVEDDMTDFLLLKELLISDNLEIGEIINLQSIKEVSETIASLYPDLIFLDLNLPDSNGPETFLRVKDLFPASSIIILSGLNQTEVIIETVKAG